MGWRERIYWSTRLSFFIHPAVLCPALPVPPPPSLLSWMRQRGPIWSSWFLRLGVHVYIWTQKTSNHSSLLLRTIQSNPMTLNWIQVLSESGNAFIFPRLTNQSLCVCSRGPLTAHTVACRVCFRAYNDRILLFDTAQKLCASIGKCDDSIVSVLLDDQRVIRYNTCLISRSL